MAIRIKLLIKNVAKVSYYSLVLGADINFEAPDQAHELKINHYIG